MIQTLGAVGLISYAICSLIVGVRCLVLASRNKTLPELALGLGLVAGVLLGYLPANLAEFTDLSDETVLLLQKTAMIFIRFTVVCTLVFTIWVFRRRSLVAYAVGAAITGVLVYTWWVHPGPRHLAFAPGEIFWHQVYTVVRSLAPAWGALEAFAYFRTSARRRDLGLTDPLVTNRFALWGCAMTCTTFLMVSPFIAPFFGSDTTDALWILLESSVGIVGAVSYWISIFPSRAYAHYIRRRHPTEDVELTELLRE